MILGVWLLLDVCLNGLSRGGAEGGGGRRALSLNSGKRSYSGKS